MEESELAEEINFPYIHDFNTVETLSQLGSNVSDLSKPILMEIGKAIGGGGMRGRMQGTAQRKILFKKDLQTLRK